MFEPTHTAALETLAKFAPNAGAAYARNRNYDLGAGNHTGVSCLSPYIRHRIISELDVLGAVLKRNSLNSCDKFVQEVFWRTYWKGWLQQRPGVWRDYQISLKSQIHRLQSEAGLQDRWQDACLGRTGIAPFDAWTAELTETGYLHNHARMWFASVWVFTLQLPWQLGADFFMRHLLDGDPASNTLSWRWVSGQQTLGKTYAATTSNIAKFTNGRFPNTPGLSSVAHPIATAPHPAPIPLTDPDAFDAQTPTLILLHCDDLDPWPILKHLLGKAKCAIMLNTHRRSPLEISPQLSKFVTGLAGDVAGRWSDRLGNIPVISPDMIENHAQRLECQQIVSPFAPVGPNADSLRDLAQGSGLTIRQHRREYDSLCWPHATRGFFKFKENIPSLLKTLGLI